MHRGPALVVERSTLAVFNVHTLELTVLSSKAARQSTGRTGYHLFNKPPIRNHLGCFQICAIKKYIYTCREFPAWLSGNKLDQYP